MGWSVIVAFPGLNTNLYFGSKNVYKTFWDFLSLVYPADIIFCRGNVCICSNAFLTIFIIKQTVWTLYGSSLVLGPYCLNIDYNSTLADKKAVNICRECKDELSVT